MPKKLVTVLEGENLLKDASALIAYKCELIAIASGNFYFWNAGSQFVTISLAGIMVGLIIGYGFLKLHRFLHGNSNVLTLLT